jgi:hypothetical protein
MSSEQFRSLDEMVSKLLREGTPIPNHADPSPVSGEGRTDSASCKAGNIEAAADKGDATIASVHARSLLAGLNLDTAIRLRWALRDIRADRTAWSPVSPDDLAALIELGLVEMRNEIPALTYEGRSAID